MNKLFLAAFFFLTSCVIDAERNKIKYECFFRNDSSEDMILLLTFVPEDPPTDSVSLSSGEMKSIGFYLNNQYASYGCIYQEIEFRFSNGKGYNCSVGANGFVNESPTCFTNGKDPFLADRLPNNGNGSITTITQADFELAFEL